MSSPFRVHLVAPSNEDSTYIKPLWAQTLAAHTPDDIELTFRDDGLDPVDLARESDAPDLVGISVNSKTAARAYAIAAAYRARGSRVVLGGIHVTASVASRSALRETSGVEGPLAVTNPPVCDKRSTSLAALAGRMLSARVPAAPRAEVHSTAPAPPITSSGLATAGPDHAEGLAPPAESASAESATAEARPAPSTGLKRPPRTAGVKPPPARSAPPPTACDPPYYADSKGHVVYKPECFQ